MRCADSNLPFFEVVLGSKRRASRDVWRQDVRKTVGEIMTAQVMDVVGLLPGVLLGKGKAMSLKAVTAAFGEKHTENVPRLAEVVMWLT